MWIIKLNWINKRNWNKPYPPELSSLSNKLNTFKLRKQNLNYYQIHVHQRLVETCFVDICEGLEKYTCKVLKVCEGL